MELATGVGSNPDQNAGPAVGSDERLSRNRQLGDYEIIEEIARGGMGVVYRARQLSLKRVVALKVLLSSQFSDTASVKRFRREAESAASLNHPNIVSIYEIGEEQGTPYFSMELIEGRSLADITREQPLQAREAAELLRDIAKAVHFAHQKGLLHRDLKPSNVIVDALGAPHVTDFGLAKLVAADQQLTVTGQVLGTPSYMPPEQADPKSGETTIASDVYSLGAILYHLLTARPPFIADTLTKTLRLVAEGEPVSPRLLNPGVPADLETICLKCLEKESSRRYHTAQDLAEELRRYLADEPIQAHPLSAPARLARWCRRKPALAVSLGSALALLLVVAIGSPIALFRINRARAASENAQRQTRAQLYTALVEQARATVRSGGLGQHTKALEAVRRAAEITNSAELRREALAALVAPDLRLVRETPLEPGTTLCQLDPALTRMAISRERGPVEIRSSLDRQLLVTLPASTNLSASVARWSADGRFLSVKRRLPVEVDVAELEVWDVNAAKRVAVLHAVPFGPVAFHPYQPLMISGIGRDITGTESGSWTVAKPMPTARAGHTATLLPNGQVLVAGGFCSNRLFSSAQVYDPPTRAWTEIRPMNAARVAHRAVVLPSGKIMVVGGQAGDALTDGAEIYNPANGTWRRTGPMNVVRAGHTVALLRDGSVLVTGGDSSTRGALADAELYDPATDRWRPVSPMRTARHGHTATVLPNGNVLVTGGTDHRATFQSAEIYDPASDTWSATDSMSTARIGHTATALHNGDVLILGGHDHGTVFFSAELYSYKTGTWISRPAMPHSRYAHTATLFPNGVLLAAGGWEEGGVLSASLDLYDTSIGATAIWSRGREMDRPRHSHTATVMPDGKVLVTGGMGIGEAPIADAEIYTPSRDFGPGVRKGGAIKSGAKVDADRSVATNSSPGIGNIEPGDPVAGEAYEISLRDLTKDGQEIRRYEIPGIPVFLQLSPTGDRFAALWRVGINWGVNVYDLATAKALASFRYGYPIPSFDWHPNGQLLAVPDHNGDVHLADLTTGGSSVLGRHKLQAESATFSPDGLHLLTGGRENEMICWDLTSRQRVLTAGLQGSHIQLATNGLDCAVVTETAVHRYRLEASPVGRELEAGFLQRVSHAAFSPDGHWLAVSGREDIGLWNWQTLEASRRITKPESATPFFTPDGSELFAWWANAIGRWRVPGFTNDAAASDVRALPVSRPWNLLSALLSSSNLILTGWGPTGRGGVEVVPLAAVSAGKGLDYAAPAGFGFASPDNRWLLIRKNLENIVWIFRLPEVKSFPDIVCQTDVLNLAFSPSGNEVAIATRGGVEFYDCTDWRRTHFLPLLMDRNASLLFAPDGRTLWVTSDVRTAALYNAQTLEQLIPMPVNILPLALTSDGRHLAVSVEGRRLEVWDLAELRRQFRELGVDWTGD